MACTEEVDANEYLEILDVNGEKTQTYKVPEELNLRENRILPQEQEQLELLVRSYADCFAPNSKRPDPVTNLEHRINTDQALPINSAPYRASPAQRKNIEKQITKMEDNQIIKPSKSPWVAPTVDKFIIQFACVLNNLYGECTFCFIWFLNQFNPGLF